MGAKNSYNKFTTIYMIKAIENVKISSGYTTTIVNGQRKEFAKKVTLLNDVTDCDLLGGVIDLFLCRESADLSRLISRRVGLIEGSI